MRDDWLISAANISVAFLGMDSAMDDIPCFVPCFVQSCWYAGMPGLAHKCVWASLA
jgi:hypothetical protein